MARCFLVFFGALLLFLIVACGEQEAKVATETPAPGVKKVVVPESDVVQWKSVKIALLDLQDGTENIYRVDIGGSFQVPGTTMRVTVKAFIPAFSTNGERTTSVSNRPTNPAVQIVVRDGEQEVHRGWLFGLYPERHQFKDPRYKLILLDYVSAG